MSSVSLYEIDINQLPHQIQQHLPVTEGSTWYDTYRTRFPLSDNKVMFIVKAPKARILANLNEPVNLQEAKTLNFQGLEYTFIADPYWIPADPKQRVLDPFTAKRIQITVKENQIEKVEELDLGFNTDPGSPVGPGESPIGPRDKARKARSLDRTIRERLREERIHQARRIDALKKQCAEAEEEKQKQIEQLNDMKVKVENLEQMNETLNKTQTKLEFDKTIQSYEDRLDAQDRQFTSIIQDQDNEIKELELALDRIKLSNTNNDNANKNSSQKKPLVNVGKIQVPIYDEETGDIYETLEQLNTVIGLAGNNKEVTKTIIYNFLQKNQWQTMINSNPKILEDFEVLRSELIERHDPQNDPTQTYVEIRQRPNEDEKDFIRRLERGYRVFAKINPSQSLTRQQKAAIMSRFATALSRKEVRVHMRGLLDEVSYEEIADKARKYRRVVETEEENKVLATSQVSTQPLKDNNNLSDEEVCKKCRLPHGSNECQASDKFRRKSNRQFYPPSNQAFTIPPKKLGHNVRFNDKFPPAEPTDGDQRSGRPRYRTQYFRRNYQQRNYSDRNNRSFDRDRSRSRDYSRNGDRSRSRDYMRNRDRSRSGEFRPRNGFRGRGYNRSWGSNNTRQNFRRNDGWRRNRPQESRLVNITQTVDHDYPSTVVDSPVEPGVDDFIF